MTEIYLVRHAQSQGNLTGRFQGRLDTPLTELGLAQARTLGARFAGVPLFGVYASPLSRAQQTAQAIAEPHGLEVGVCADIIEINGGVIEDMAFTDLLAAHPEQFEMFDKQPHLFGGFEGAESIADVYERTIRAVDGIADAHPGQIVAVVSHGLPIRCYTCHARGWTFEQLGQAPWAKNTSVWHITYDNGVATLHTENDLTHLPKDIGGENKGLHV